MRIYVAGINGMVGSAIALEARRQGHKVFGRPSTEIDFTNREDVFKELHGAELDALVIAAAKVGGIGANSRFPVNFLSENLQIQTNMLDSAHAANIERVLFLGSSCVYPKLASQPIRESALLTGELEQTNAPYAIAKITGIKLTEAYRNQFRRKWISAMPTNLYGPRDSFEIESAHVLPALIHRIHDAKISGAKEIDIWGDGTPLREFLHVDDLARACMLLLEVYDESMAINIGSGHEISVMKLATLISNIIGFTGAIKVNTNYPNGTPRKLLDSSLLLELGWRPRVSLEEGIRSTYHWFIEHYTKGPNI